MAKKYKIFLGYALITGIFVFEGIYQQTVKFLF